MNNKETILTGIKNLKMQIKRLMTEVHALENMVGEMENSLDSEDNHLVHLHITSTSLLEYLKLHNLP